MARLARMLIAMMFGGSLLLAQIPNPLNLPDPLGLSRNPGPSHAEPRSPAEGRRVERRPRRNSQRNRGRHKGQEKHGNHDRGLHKGQEKH
jgi:hypothetical protein